MSTTPPSTRLVTPRNPPGAPVQNRKRAARQVYTSPDGTPVASTQLQATENRQDDTAALQQEIVYLKGHVAKLLVDLEDEQRKRRAILASTAQSLHAIRTHTLELVARYQTMQESHTKACAQLLKAHKTIESLTSAQCCVQSECADDEDDEPLSQLNALSTIVRFSTCKHAICMRDLDSLHSNYDNVRENTAAQTIEVRCPLCRQYSSEFIHADAVLHNRNFDVPDPHDSETIKEAADDIQSTYNALAGKLEIGEFTSAALSFAALESVLFAGGFDVDAISIDRELQATALLSSSSPIAAYEVVLTAARLLLQHKRRLTTDSHEQDAYVASLSDKQRAALSRAVCVLFKGSAIKKQLQAMKLGPPALPTGDDDVDPEVAAATVATRAAQPVVIVGNDE